MLTHPEVAGINCDDCRLWLYDLKTGKKELYLEKPIPRPKEVKTPCEFGPNECPKGHYKSPKSLTRENLQAYFHYLRCKATNQFPDDEMVRRNAAFIRQIEDFVQQSRISSYLAIGAAIRAS